MSDEELKRPAPPGYRSALTELEGLNPRERKLAIQKMNTGQKKLLVSKGNAATRRILLQDPNTEIQLAVVASPKVTESEIAHLAGLASTAELVLRAIAENPLWTRSYRIKQCLATNPKTPIGIATRCLRSLAAHDLKKICNDPHLRRPLVQAAQLLLKSRK